MDAPTGSLPPNMDARTRSLSPDMHARIGSLSPDREAPAGTLLASEAGHEALPTGKVSRDDRLFNFIRFEVANNDINRSSHFFNMISARTAM